MMTVVLPKETEHMTVPPGVGPDGVAPRAEQAAYLDLAMQIQRDIHESQAAGEEPAFCWLMQDVVGAVDDTGGASGDPPPFRSYYGAREIERNFTEVAFSGFDSSGVVVHLRQPFRTDDLMKQDRYFTAVFWDRQRHQRPGEAMWLHDMDVRRPEGLETEPGADNVVVLVSNDTAIKVVRDPQTGACQHVFLGKRVGHAKERFRFDVLPLTPLSVLVRQIQELGSAPRSAGELLTTAAEITVSSSLAHETEEVPD